MAEERMQRRVDEEGTLARLKILRDEIIDTAIADAHGRIIKTNGRRLPD